MALGVAKQCTSLGAERLGKPLDGRQATILPALLDLAQLRAMHTDDVGELLLAKPQALTSPPNGSSKRGKGSRALHGGEVRFRSTYSLQYLR